jgi:hypothetical protein
MVASRNPNSAGETGGLVAPKSDEGGQAAPANGTDGNSFPIFILGWMTMVNLWFNPAMFNFFKRDPVREKLKIPTWLYWVTLTGASNACNILNGAGLQGKFSRKDMFAEVCGVHVKTVIATMSRMEGFIGFIGERFDKGAQFLLENVPGVLNRMKDPKALNRLKSQGFTLTDLALMEQLLIADKTFNLAASYYTGMELDVSDGDVLDYGRKYNPKLLALSSEDRSNSAFAYIVRCVRLSHLEDIPHMEFRTSYLTRFNDTLMQAALELERNVEKLMPTS